MGLRHSLSSPWIDDRHRFSAARAPVYPAHRHHDLTTLAVFRLIGVQVLIALSTCVFLSNVDIDETTLKTARISFTRENGDREHVLLWTE